MEAKELRIGNFVNYKFWNPNPKDPDWAFEAVEIIGILKKTFYFKSINSNRIIKIGELHPIPLTEEWLVRFGLQCYQFDNGQPNQYRFKDRIIVIRYGRFYDYGSGVLLEYVHKFQNFCFEITGEEPTIK